jgi:tetratricopeptide (TPR) repeat protein
MRRRSFPASSKLFVAVVFCGVGVYPQAYAQISREAPLTSPEERAALHRSADWMLVAPHLPDPDVASAKELETAADVLRARRFPEDALDYYGYAMARGGNVSELLNKMGVVRLELRQNEVARQMFLRTVHVQKKNAIAWNNLGATEFAEKNYGAAISDYRHAVKLDRRSAVYHSNLGMAYFEKKDMESARSEFSLAVKIDPTILQGNRESGGSIAHIAGSQNYGELCFEMAKIYAHDGKLDLMRQWLAKAAEFGYDVRAGMNVSSALAPFRKDPEVVQMLANAAQLRARSTPAGASVPSLGPSPQQIN